MKRVLVDLDSLTEAQKADLARKQHDKTLSLDFNGEDIRSWKAKAKAAGQTLTRWIEKILNSAK